MRRTLIALTAALGFAAGCTTMPQTEGPLVQILPGFYEPRSLDSIELTVHEGTLAETIHACAMLRARHDPATAAALIALGSVTYSCAHVKRTSCTIYVVEGWEDARRHEELHCRGFDHPKHDHRESKV